MKALILVDNPSQVPAAHKSGLLVITQLNWQEMYHYLQSKTSNLYVYLHCTCPFERLLKLIEEYQGNLAVYTDQFVDVIFLSRFTRVLSRRTVAINKDYATKSDNQKLLDALMKVVI